MTQTRLKQLREEAVLTVHELAEASGVSDDTISKIENGQRIARPSTLRKLAQALVVSPQELRKPAAVEEVALAGKAEAPRAAGPTKAAGILDLPDEHFAELITEADDDELGEMKRELAPHLPTVRVIGDQNDTLHRAQRIAISRILAIVREQDARLKVEKKRLEELIPA